MLKRALRARSDLRLLVTSATLDTAKFAAYLDDCPILTIPGRTFDVAVYHTKTSLSAKVCQPYHHEHQQHSSHTLPPRQARLGRARGKGSTSQAVVDVVVRIQQREQEAGDVLAFMTGQAEIERTCAALRAAAEQLENKPGYKGLKMLVLPLYGALPSDQQALVRVR